MTDELGGHEREPCMLCVLVQQGFPVSFCGRRNMSNSLGTVKKRELPEVYGKGQSYRKFRILPREPRLIAQCQLASEVLPLVALGCWRNQSLSKTHGDVAEQPQEGDCLPLSFSSRATVAGKGWGEGGGCRRSGNLPLEHDHWLLCSHPVLQGHLLSSCGRPARLEHIPGSNRG